MNWYDITKRYNKVKHKTAGWDLNEGIDCLTMIILFMKDIGHDVDDYINGSVKFEYEGMDRSADNFADGITEPKDIYKGLKAFLNTTCKKVVKQKKGDICFFKYAGKYPTVGIYLGQGTVMSVFEKLGVKKLKLRNFDIQEIYRWELN